MSQVWALDVDLRASMLVNKLDRFVSSCINSQVKAMDALMAQFSHYTLMKDNPGGPHCSVYAKADMPT